MQSENCIQSDFLYVGDRDRAVLLEDASVRVLLGFTDRLFDDVNAFDDNPAFDGVDIENSALFAFVVTSDDLNGVTLVYVCFNTHCVISVEFD